jgi:hypothetical protein
MAPSDALRVTKDSLPEATLTPVTEEVATIWKVSPVLALTSVARTISVGSGEAKGILVEAAITVPFCLISTVRRPEEFAVKRTPVVILNLELTAVPVGMTMLLDGNELMNPPTS